MPVFTRSFSILSVGALAALCVLLVLGSWQVQRLQWKEALIATVNAKVKAAPVPLASVVESAMARKGTESDPQYNTVTVSGTFDHGQEFFYYATLNGRPGWHLYTLFNVSDTPGQKLFVNRGYIPDELRPQEKRQEALPDGEVTITGMFRWPENEKPNRFTPDNEMDERKLFWRNLDGMVKTAGLTPESAYPFFVYAENKKDGTYPRGGVTIVKFTNNHLGYAVTWFGLALTLIGVYAGMLFGRVKASRMAGA